MRIWEHTFQELTAGKEPTGGPDGQSSPQPFIAATIVPITRNPRFATAMLGDGGNTFANQVLLELREGIWVCVGGYVYDTILVDKVARGQGLAEELFLRCAEHRNDLPITTALTHMGYAFLQRTHRVAIERAARANLPVPKAVLAEYPDLPSGSGAAHDGGPKN